MKRVKENKKSFWKIWAGIAVPVLLLTGAALLGLLYLLLFVIFQWEVSRSLEIAWEQSAYLEGVDMTKLQDEDGEAYLDLEIFHMVVILYDETGNIVAESGVDQYSQSKSEKEPDDPAQQTAQQASLYGTEQYLHMKSELEEKVDEAMEASLAKIGYFGRYTSPFQYQYIYGQVPVRTGTETFLLRYGCVIHPWKEYGGRLVMIGSFMFGFMILFSLLMAVYYHKIYQKQVSMREYYRNTSNALAHDLKTPLMAISGYAQNLRENVHTEKREYYADAILTTVETMSDMVENVLELARMEHIAVRLNRQETDLRAVTEEVTARLGQTVEEKKLQVEIEGRLTVCADRQLMQRALGNLIGNAVKYTPAGEKILIFMGEGQYRIRNYGVTIPEQIRKTLWQPFVKGEPSRNQVSGTGIGLTIVKNILKLHGFSCRIENIENSVEAVIFF